MEKKMKLFRECMTTPDNAQKTIKGGRISGFTDINPMWRIKKLTEMFGACGDGWKIDIDDIKFNDGCDGQIAVLCRCSLQYKLENGEWSAPLIGYGGNMFVVKERNGLYTDDEAVKKAVSDAIGSSCKLLGMSADIYYEKGFGERTKYTSPTDGAPTQTKPKDDLPLTNAEKILINSCMTQEELADLFNSTFGGNQKASIAVKRQVTARLAEIQKASQEA